MEVSAQPELEEKSTFTVLITGANSGVGFAICCRLIDEFLHTRPQSHTLHLLYSTRDARKSEDTLRRLKAHLQKTLREANGKTMGISLLLEGRIKLEGVKVDLLRLLSVKALAEDLLSRQGLKLDAVVWNAGIGGWTGMNWGLAIWKIMTDLIYSTTYPTYLICDVGSVTKKQIENSSSTTNTADEEPQLGQIFTANVFGHYLLTHYLSPLMVPSTRIIWISSVSAAAETFSISDIQGLYAKQSYEASKRLTDYLVLTSSLPSTKPYTDALLSSSRNNRSNQSQVQVSTNAFDIARPKMYAVHPGLCVTSIASMPWILELGMFLAFWLARFLGSPWHTATPYKGAVSAVHTVLAPDNQLPVLEAAEGKGKWGSAVGVFGDERVARTEVEGWGYCGRVGVVPTGSVTGSLYRGRRETDKESREAFEEIGRRCWREMEEMRVQWDRRLGPVETRGKVSGA